MMSSDNSPRRAGFVAFRLALPLVFALLWPSARVALAKNRLICCGAEEVFILDLDPVESAPPPIVWTWTAEDSPAIPEEGKRSFATNDECKPLGEFIMITSSSGGVALVRRSDKTCHFYTQARNAHSACLLPGNRVAVASSFGGDELLVYRRTAPSKHPATPIATLPLRGAHGAVWDHQLERLWALGSDELLLIELGDEKDTPSLTVEKRIKLPTPGGHDLSESRETSTLYVTTNEHVYRFNKQDESFSPHPVLADEPKVKSVSEHPQTGEIVYHQGTPETWWSDTIRFIGERESIQLPNRRLYKIRWDK